MPDVGICHREKVQVGRENTYESRCDRSRYGRLMHGGPARALHRRTG